MNTRWDVLRNHMLSVGIVAVSAVVAWFVAGRTSELILMITVGALALVVAVYVGLRHPLLFYWGLAVVLGFLPFGYVPGVHLPLYLVFTAGAVAAALVHPGQPIPVNGLTVAVGALLVTALASLVATDVGLTALLVFVQWAFCTVLFFAVLKLTYGQLRRFGQIFVFAVTANSAFGIAMNLFDPSQSMLRILKPFGYGEGVGLRAQTQLYAFGEQAVSLRLGGTWVLPNTAGLAIVIALAICFVVFDGWVRVWLSAIMLAALALTLSRSAIFSLALGVVVVLVFHTMRARYRFGAIGLTVALSGAAMMVPAVRDRVLSSFGSSDVGAEARTEALRDFPGLMSGRWIFGAGWGGEEFKVGEIGQRLNPPSNVPLLTVYRAGILTGLAITAVLIIACILAYYLIRTNSLPYALFGGIVIGVCLGACQLDKTIVDILPLTATFSAMLAFLIQLNRTPPPGPRHAYSVSQEFAGSSRR